MKLINIPTLTIFFVAQLTAASFSDWNPTCYNAVKWTSQNQGQETIAFTSAAGITRVPMAYHGGVDWNESGSISQKNIEHFSTWVEETLPPDYCGPVVMDYERPWRKELSSVSIQPERLQEILSVYVEGVKVARGTRPNAQWGYWGLPMLRNTGKAWKEQGLSLEQLSSQCLALYPDIYDTNPSQPQLVQTKQHVTSVLALASGRIPVYVFVSPRFSGQGGDHSQFVPHDVFLKQVNAAMRAVWMDEQGIQHRIQGVIFWDTYKFTEESGWEDLDKKHTYYFRLLQALMKAWEKSMNGIQVNTSQINSPSCVYALSEPRNSGDTIPTLKEKDSMNRNGEVPIMENERVPSGRIRSNRIRE